LQGAIVPILVCWVRHCLNIFVIQDYFLSGPQETGTDPVFIYIHSGYTLQLAVLVHTCTFNKIYKLLKLNEKISFFIHFIYFIYHLEQKMTKCTDTLPKNSHGLLCKSPSFIVFIICKCMLSAFSYNPYIMYKCTSHCIYGMYRATLIEKYKFINMMKNLA
jgi:hypothetical protein